MPESTVSFILVKSLMHSGIGQGAHEKIRVLRF